ncbi:MAG: ATP-grasp domain-containing protein [Thermofilaceae archaeon]
MARLHEYQGKELLRKYGINTPEGQLASSPEEARRIAAELARPVVVKAQVWVTGRASLGGIRFADSPDEAAAAARQILSLKVRSFPVERVLVEERLSICRELYAGLLIDDSARRPLLLVSSVGGTGIEEIARSQPEKVARLHVDLGEGVPEAKARRLVGQVGIDDPLQTHVADVLVRLYQLARGVEARAAEINPLVLTTDGRLVAADCRITVDDYAVFRHPELGIEIARELNHPPTLLDKIAYEVEKNDYRGTFYFAQMEQGFEAGQGYIGFHGAGGGGSMMAMDALMRRGFKVANFCDTSGNPPASKVYRAAKIILAQPNIDAYFGSGSGVASQEQFHVARGLVKAFREENLSIPAVMRLGGNGEDQAVEILENYTRDLPAPVKGFKKDDSIETCVEYLQMLLTEQKRGEKREKPIRRQAPAPLPEKPYQFDIRTGQIIYDHALCAKCETKICVQVCVPQILKLENGVPVLAITREEAKQGGCIECLACEVECWFHGHQGARILLPIPGLDEYLRAQSPLQGNPRILKF